MCRKFANKKTGQTWLIYFVKNFLWDKNNEGLAEKNTGKIAESCKTTLFTKIKHFHGKHCNKRTQVKTQTKNLKWKKFRKRK